MRTDCCGGRHQMPIEGGGLHSEGGGGRGGGLYLEGGLHPGPSHSCGQTNVSENITVPLHSVKLTVCSLQLYSLHAGHMYLSFKQNVTETTD